MDYYRNPKQNQTPKPHRNEEIRNRVISRREQKKMAKERYRGRSFVFRDGILYFAGTTDRVPGSIMIQKPKKVG